MSIKYIINVKADTVFLLSSGQN